MSAPQTSIVKILVIGDVATGKTSIIHRYAHKQFEETHRPTLGVEFALKKLKVNDQKYNVQLWDIAGQERFIGLAPAYYKKAEAAVVVIDVSQRKTLDNGILWKKDVDDKVYLRNSEPIPVILFVNKWDLIEDGSCDVNEKAFERELEEFVEAHGFIGWFSTSARSGRNIKEGFIYLVSEVVGNRKRIDAQMPPETPDPTIVDINRSSSKASAPSSGGDGCC